MAEVRPANLGLLSGNDLVGSLRLPVCANYENSDVCVLLPSSGNEWGETRRPGVPAYPLLIRIFYWIPPSTPAHTAPSTHYQACVSVLLSHSPIEISIRSFHISNSLVKSFPYALHQTFLKYKSLPGIV